MEDISINLFGTGCTIAVGYIPHDDYNKIKAYRKANNLSLEEVISDYKNLLWLDIGYVKKWVHFGTTHNLKGLYDNQYSFIEIKVGNRKRTKILLGDIFYQRSLFPIYNKQIQSIDMSVHQSDLTRIIIVETVIGKIGNVRFVAEKFDIDKMSFSFSDFQIRDHRLEYKILESASYDGKPLIFKNPDVLVNGFFTIIN